MNWLNILKVYLMVVSLCGLLLPVSAQTQLGDQIENVAYVSYLQDGRSVTIRTAPAQFQVAARPSQSQVSFYRYAPGLADSQLISLRPTEYSVDGTETGAFLPIGEASPLPGVTLDLSQPVPIGAVENYLATDMIIVGVEDLGHNLDPTRVESVTISIASGKNTPILLKLFEDGADSGRFYGYVPTYTNATASAAVGIQVDSGANLVATYSDAYSQTDVNVRSVFISGNGRVFNALTDTPINGARVSIFNADTGAPANVFGQDTVATFPSEVLTGRDERDSAGTLYEVAAGEFLFPFLKKGRYAVLIEPPSEYIFPSLISSASRTGKSTGGQKTTVNSQGLVFELSENGTLAVNVPVDPVSDIAVQKSAERQTVAIGDFVPYRVEVINRGENDAYIRLRDVAPRGFRMEDAFLETESGRSRLQVDRVDGRTSEFDLGVLPVGEQQSLVYTMRVAPGAQTGRQTNRIFLLNGRDDLASNVAMADTFVQEDLLRSTGTITGTVRAGSCSVSGQDSSENPGLAGIQIYMETGDYVTTDTRGKFHFQNVRPGTHIVQVDEYSLPEGYELVLCENNTRSAGSSRSRFVDMTGGAISQVDFVVRKKPMKYAGLRPLNQWPAGMNSVRTDTPTFAHSQSDEVASTLAEPAKRYDLGWLNKQDNSTAWIYPSETDTLATPALDLAVKHAAELRAVLFVNNSPTASANQSERLLSSDAERVLSRWQGVDLQDGENLVRLVLQNRQGLTVDTLTRTITYTSKISRAVYLPEASVLVADGKTSPQIAIKLMDQAGNAVHAGRIVSVDIAPPYRLFQENRQNDALGITTSLAAQGGVTVGEGGIARIALDPTFQSGMVNLSLTLENDRVERLNAYLVATARPWIVVGLAEGTVGIGADPGTRGDVDPLLGDEDPFADGRMAFFAKGTVADEWLVTVGVDTDKRRGDSDSNFSIEIDPTANFTQYGDQTYQQRAAQSRFPVFAKVERDQFQALFGDFQTGLNTTELTRYSRQLSGLQLQQGSERYQLSAFAAETDQKFQRLELAADGTSGPYRLNSVPILVQSERIYFETRDRFRPDLVLETRTFTRYLDYDIDYISGEIIFVSPLPATDAAFNPNVILIEYETAGLGERELTAGARGELRLREGKFRLGASAIREAATGPSMTEAKLLAGVDLRYALNDTTAVRAEYASSDLGAAAVAGEGPVQDALFFELNHQNRLGTLLAYFREENTGFGLGQQTQATQDIRRYGVSMTRNLGHEDNAQTGLRKNRNLQVEAYEETNLTTESSRRLARAQFIESDQNLTWDSGLTYSDETFNGQPKRESVLLSSGVRKYVADAGLTLQARHEQAISGANDVAQFPQRTLVGLDKAIGDKATLNLRHEWVDGTNISGQTSSVGVTLRPWQGANLRTGFDQIATESGARLGANFGLDQTFAINERWTTGFGFAQRVDLDPADDGLDALPTLPLSPLVGIGSVSDLGSEAYASGYAGIGYRTPEMFASSRAEFRTDDLSTRVSLAASAARQVTDSLTFAGAARYTHSDPSDGPDNENLEAQLGLAHRPDDDSLILYNRFDFRREKRVGELENWKLVNNLSAYKPLGDKTELGVFLGTKYAETTLYDSQYKGWTHLIGADLRRDITPNWDVGVAGSVLFSPEAGTADYGIGASVGYSPVKNVWMGVGYNFDGVKDTDFAASEYARSGPYIQLRMKFDEDAVEGALDRILGRNR